RFRRSCRLHSAPTPDRLPAPARRSPSLPVGPPPQLSPRPDDRRRHRLLEPASPLGSASLLGPASTPRACRGPSGPIDEEVDLDPGRKSTVFPTAIGAQAGGGEARGHFGGGRFEEDRRLHEQ